MTHRENGILHRMRIVPRWVRSYLPHLRALIALGLIAFFLFSGAFMLWAANLTMPSWESVEARRVEQSSKIYDRTGEILLYDMHQEIRRTIIPIEEMSRYVKNAAVAIEDDNFYHHHGIEPTAILRAIISNLRAGDLFGGQGGSTITQQVVKNTLLEADKRLSRKFKEWVLAIKLERQLTKEEILELYLNESPYGGNKYGVEEASQSFFNKSAADVTLAEAAYLASLPQAPTYLSPYGNNRDALDARKDQTLKRMLELGFITEEEYTHAMEEEVLFQPQRNTGISAPHFVFYVIDELREIYSERELLEGGLRIITSLDWRLQEPAEEIVNRYALENAEKFDAENAALVATDPKTGEILVMVGSRDYFDDAIEGNFNIALAERQPGSAFKPFVYAEAINKGYTSETVVFDVATQFSTSCEAYRFTNEDGCYAPVNYDGIFRGPISFRNALAQSVNVPAVKALYLAGVRDSMKLAERMGITTLTDPSRYGLTLVLGGGEVRLLDMTGAYGTFANDGVHAKPKAVLRIEDRNGKVLREFPTDSEEALPADTARAINNMLSDNVARAPAFGANSFLYFPGRQVAAKTGTTNDYRDAWILGYTPEIAAGAWAGNNNNHSMDKRVAGFIIAPLWNEFMQKAFEIIGATSDFSPPPPIPQDLKPILRGIWQGSTISIDTRTGAFATADTPPEFRRDVSTGSIHSLLHWVNPNDPRGPAPTNPASDSQYALWEYGVQFWKAGNHIQSQTLEELLIQEGIRDNPDDTSHSSGSEPRIRITQPDSGKRYSENDTIRVRVSVTKRAHPIDRVEFYINSMPVGSSSQEPYSFSFIPNEVEGVSEENTLQAFVYDEEGTYGTDSITFRVR